MFVDRRSDAKKEKKKKKRKKNSFLWCVMCSKKESFLIFKRDNIVVVKVYSKREKKGSPAGLFTVFM